MATHDIKTVTLPNGDVCNLRDNSKQPTLVSGSNIKTVNNNSLLGSGNINIQGGSDCVELTQAEYDALPQSEKENGAVYFITDGVPEYTVINDSVPIGAIQAYGGTSLPYGWLFCDGTAVSRETYSELFSAIGTAYGAGDGSTTFNLPDLRGRVVTGVGSADGVTYTIGDKIDAGVPNITGGANMLGHTAGISYGITTSDSGWFGAMRSKNNSNSASLAGGTGYTPAQKDSGFDFDASRSDSHYGKSSTVQPNTTVTNYIIKALNTVSSSALEELDPQHILFDMFYPVGSYYETSDATFDPNVQWRGTWTLETAGQVHVSAGTGYDVGDTGGEATHTLTVDEIPSHNHTYEALLNQTELWVPVGQVNQYGYGNIRSKTSSSTGGSQSHNNMQPYIVVNRWHRTA